jgi:hypothetical protein
MKRLIPFLLLALGAVVGPWACDAGKEDRSVVGPALGVDCDKNPQAGPCQGGGGDEGGKEKTYAFLFPTTPEDAQAGIYQNQKGTHLAVDGPAGVDCYGPVFEDRTPLVGPGAERYMLCAPQGGQSEPPVFVLRVEDSSGNGVSGGTLIFGYCADNEGNPTPGVTCCCTPPGRRTDYNLESVAGTPVDGFLGYFSVSLPGAWPRWNYEGAVGVGLFYDADDKGNIEWVRKWYEFVSGFDPE